MTTSSAGSSNRDSNRQSNVVVTATWENGATDISASGAIFVSNLAPALRLAVPLNPTAGCDRRKVLNSVTATGQVTGTRPTGGLHVTTCTLAGDVCTGTVANDGTRHRHERRRLGRARHAPSPDATLPRPRSSDARAGSAQRLRDHLRGRDTGTAQTVIAKTNRRPGGTSTRAGTTTSAT